MDDMIAIKAKIAMKFECVDKGPLREFLGMQVDRNYDTGSIVMNQAQYIKGMLQRHSMEVCRAVATPLDASYQVACSDEKCVIQDVTMYQSAIGELMWLALTSRPDIYRSVIKLAQRNKEPHSEHVAAVKHVMRYLAATKDLKLHYRSCGDALTGYADADWGGDVSNRKSYTGYVFFLAGGPIS
ncbi:secreted RxLR effector protein 161-like [Drosophila willistoni]|uniref:secreted RxLR effector protein 161-like n=1 Tax=Drosophila willistoni TaxID=7260 RepID=UPI001F077202|nr:secreted RxLR effector protein 161-like [Drosophila willistoni]